MKPGMVIILLLTLSTASYGASSVYIPGGAGSAACTNSFHGTASLAAGQSGYWAVPAGVCQIVVTLWAAGADGGVIRNYLLTVTSGSIACTVGVHGDTGGNTTFGSLLAAGGAGAYSAGQIQLTW